MSDEERALLRLINQRVARMQPAMAKAFRQYFKLLTIEMGTARVAALLAAQRYDELLNDEVFARMTAPLRQQFQDSMREGFRLTLPDIPKTAAGGGAGIIGGGGSIIAAAAAGDDGPARIFFDVLNPRVTRAIEGLESRTLDTLKKNARQTLRQTISAGLAEGQHPDEIARDLRSVVGLSKQQARFVRNMGDDLANLDDHYFTRALRDKRYDAKVRNAIKTGKPLTAADREKITAAYARKYTKYNTEINTRAATLDSYRLAQWEAFASARDRGIYGPDELEKIWVHFDPQDYPREDHKAWNGIAVGFDQPFPDGQQQAGLGYYGCRCSTRYRARRKTAPTPVEPTDAPTRLRTAVEQAEREILPQKVEYAVAFDRTGKEVMRKTSHQLGSVSFTDAEFNRLKDTVFTHNHPRGTLGLSDADVKFLITGDLAEMRAVTTGQVARMIRPEDGWKPGEWQSVVRPAMARHREALRAEWSDLVRAGSMPEDDFHKNFWHELWTRVAKDTGLNYRSESRTET